MFAGDGSSGRRFVSSSGPLGIFLGVSCHETRKDPRPQIPDNVPDSYIRLCLISPSLFFGGAFAGNHHAFKCHGRGFTFQSEASPWVELQLKCHFPFGVFQPLWNFAERKSGNCRGLALPLCFVSPLYRLMLGRLEVHCKCLPICSILQL